MLTLKYIYDIEHPQQTEEGEEKVKKERKLALREVLHNVDEKTKKKVKVVKKPKDKNVF